MRNFVQHLLFMSLPVLAVSCTDNVGRTLAEEQSIREESGEYRIVFGGPGTKSGIESLYFNFADFEYELHCDVWAELVKKNAKGDWDPVENNVTFIWNTDGKVSVDNEGVETEDPVLVSGDAVGSGTLTVKGLLSGKEVAEKSIPVTVEDDRKVEWSRSEISFYNGESVTVKVTSNYSDDFNISDWDDLFDFSETDTHFYIGHQSEDVTFEYEEPQFADVVTTAEVSGKAGCSYMEVEIPFKWAFPVYITHEWQEIPGLHDPDTYEYIMDLYTDPNPEFGVTVYGEDDYTIGRVGSNNGYLVINSLSTLPEDITFNGYCFHCEVANPDIDEYVHYTGTFYRWNLEYDISGDIWFYNSDIR